MHYKKQNEAIVFLTKEEVDALSRVVSRLLARKKVELSDLRSDDIKALENLHFTSMYDAFPEEDDCHNCKNYDSYD